MQTILETLLRKQQDYLKYQEEQEERSKAYKVIADEKIESLFIHFTDKLRSCIEASRTPQIIIPFRFMKQIRRCYTESEFNEIIQQRLKTELPDFLIVSHTSMIRKEHNCFGPIQVLLVTIIPTIDLNKTIC